MVHTCIVPGGETKEFFDAVEHGDVAAVARMLASDSALANAIDPRGKPLWAKGEWPRKRADPCQPPAKLRLQNHNALHVAASLRHTEIARLLIASGADVNACYAKSPSPLQCAITPWFEPPRGDVVELLIASGAEVPKDAIPLALEYKRHEDPTPVIDVLLKNGADPNSVGKFGPPLRLALSCNQNTALVELLIRAGADVNPPPRPDKPPELPLRIAARNRNPEVVRLLIEAGADVSAACARGALHAIVSLADDRGLELLLRAGANPNVCDDQHRTALESIETYLRVLAMLEGPRPEPARPPREPAAHRAERSWRSRTVEELLKSESPQGDLFRAIVAGDPYAVCRVLDEYPALVNARSKYWTPLQLAAAAGQRDVVAVLLDRGASMTWCSSSQSVRALDTAASYGRSEVVKLLLERGAENRDTALLAAVRSGSTETTEILLHAGANPNTRRSLDGRTPLQIACDGSSSPVVELLLSHGANVNPITPADQYGWGEDCDIWPMFSDKELAQPLYIAVVNGSFEIVDILLDAGADINALSFGWSALHAACLAPHPEMVGHLLAHGADIHVKSADGRTLLELMKGYRRCAELLRAAMNA
jgi:ankyrin repeat protein